MDRVCQKKEQYIVQIYTTKGSDKEKEQKHSKYQRKISLYYITYNNLILYSRY